MEHPHDAGVSGVGCYAGRRVLCSWSAYADWQWPVVTVVICYMCLPYLKCTETMTACMHEAAMHSAATSLREEDGDRCVPHPPVPVVIRSQRLKLPCLSTKRSG